MKLYRVRKINTENFTDEKYFKTEFIRDLFLDNNSYYIYEDISDYLIVESAKNINCKNCNKNHICILNIGYEICYKCLKKTYDYEDLHCCNKKMKLK